MTARYEITGVLSACGIHVVAVVLQGVKIPVPRDSAEYCFVEDRFREGGYVDNKSGPRVPAEFTNEIVSVERIQHSKLWSLYSNHRAEVAAANGGNPNELYAYWAAG